MLTRERRAREAAEQALAEILQKSQEPTPTVEDRWIETKRLRETERLRDEAEQYRLLAEIERLRAELERKRADEERQRADAERSRLLAEVDRLLAEIERLTRQLEICQNGPAGK